MQLFSLAKSVQMHIVGIDSKAKFGSTFTCPLFDAWNSYKHVQLKCRPQTVRDRVHVRPCDRPFVRPLRIYYTLRRRGGNRERERAKVPRVSSHLNLRLRLWPPSLGRKRGGVLTLLNSSHNFTPISPGQCLPPLSLFLDRGLLLLY